MNAKANNSQEFANIVTTNVLNCRSHDVAQIQAMTGCTEAVALAARLKHGDKWTAVYAIKGRLVK